ncbi:MAG: hypothetical protein K2L87_03555 [Clostridiales bacterium]|nr:hypothetical protein [Clostridiales bacterium]
MRRFLVLVREFAVILSVAACIAVLALFSVMPVFGMGKSYTLYNGASSSSFMVATNAPMLDKARLKSVAGESTVYGGDKYEQLKAQFSATLLFTEEACGVTNYYLYSPDLGDGVYLNGAFINLHIAVSTEQTAVGTPLIFGGY